eukprot:Skav229537  [mRNA]  locus=scaffold568:49055:58809:- [translate_table: standard]
MCHLKTARRHQAGTSCRPFSRRGTKLGLLDTETINLLAWVGLRICLQEPDITQENVESHASKDVIARFLGPMYWIDQYIGDPTHFGWPVARSRQFLRLRHRVKVLEQLSPLTNFAKRFWRAVDFQWTEMLRFHKPELRDKSVVEDEIQSELDWAQARPNSQAHGQCRLVLGVQDEPFLLALTETEALHWKAYKARWPGTAGQLNQDSMSPHATHSSKDCLHTLIANCGLIMSDRVSPERWILASECLLAQGFPVLPGCFGDQIQVKSAIQTCLQTESEAGGDVQPEASGSPDESVEDGAVKPSSAQGKRQLVGKKLSLKKKLWTPYSAQEKQCFVTFVENLAHDEKREKTALDEVITALQYAADSSASGKVTAPAAKRQKRGDPGEHAAPELSGSAATSKTMSFCLSIFLEFVFQGEVSVNGKLVKAYSALRSELQQIMLSAHETFVASSSEGQKVDAMELAALLTQQFADKPVMMVIGDDEEESCAKRVTSIMNIPGQRESIANPLKDFVLKKLHLPLMLHPVPQQTLLELSAFVASKASSMNTLVDLVAFVQSKLEEMMPFSWALFASDVSEVFVTKGHFIESSGEAKLESALWEWYLNSKTYENDNVIVNLSSKKLETYVKYPISEDVELPYVGRVSMVKTKNSFPFVNLFGVQFWIEDCQSADILIPAWTSKTVTRSDIAYFSMKTTKCKVVLIRPKSKSNTATGSEKISLSSPYSIHCHLAVLENDESLDIEAVPSWALDEAYSVSDGALVSLVPLTDVEDKVSRELSLQKQRAEKQARSQVEQFLKQRKDANQQQTNVKSKKAKSASAKNSSVDNLAESLLVNGLPEEPKEKVAALEKLLAVDEKLNQIIENAKGKVTTPDRLAITKMASEEYIKTSSGRAKAMQEALVKAKRQEAKTADSEEEADTTGTPEGAQASALGLGAIRAHAEKTGSVAGRVKKINKEKSQSAKSDIAKLGKHLLK